VYLVVGAYCRDGCGQEGFGTRDISRYIRKREGKRVGDYVVR
jgi:hypothetical protein